MPAKKKNSSIYNVKINSKKKNRKGNQEKIREIMWAAIGGMKFSILCK